MFMKKYMLCRKIESCAKKYKIAEHIFKTSIKTKIFLNTKTRRCNDDYS